MGPDSGDSEVNEIPNIEPRDPASTQATSGSPLDRSRMPLLDRYADNHETRKVIELALKLPSALSGKLKDNPFPRHEDKEGVKNMVRIQKDFIRILTRLSEGGTTPEDLEELQDFYSIAQRLDATARQELAWNAMGTQEKQTATEARAWWKGIKAEAAMVSSFLYADYDVVLPEGEDVIAVDYDAGTDFLAHKDGRVYAIDAKSGLGAEKTHYRVEDDSHKPLRNAVKDLVRRNFPQASSITQATITVEPNLLPSLPREENPSKQVKNIRNFLAFPQGVENGFLNELNRLELRKGV